MQVVDAGQHWAQHFAAAVQVVQVGTAKTAAPALRPRHAAARRRGARAGVAGAAGVQRLLVQLVARVADFEVAKTGEQGAVARVARRHDAVEHVDAFGHTLHQIFWRADPHQVTRFVRRQLVRRVRHDAQHFVFRLAHADATDGVTGEIHRHQLLQRFLAQVLKHAALDNAEQRVRVLQLGELRLAALGPAQAEFHRTACFRLGGELALGLGFDRNVGRAFVKLHDDVTVEHSLDLH